MRWNAVGLGTLTLLFGIHLGPLLGQTVERFARFGGSGSDRVTAMISDLNGDLFITGSTKSTGLATSGAFQTEIAGVGITGGDAYVAKLDGSTLTPIWVTYLGGSGSENGTSTSGGLTVGPGSVVIVAGTTSSSNFPTTPDALQAAKNGVGEDLFVAMLSPDGSELLYSTFLGGSAGDLLTGFGRDGQGHLYLAGLTTSADLPVTANAVQGGLSGTRSGFLLRLASDARSIEYGTYFGGTGGDQINSLAVRSSSEVWIGGDTSSSDLPVTSDAFDRTLGGCGSTACDAFLASVDTDAGQLTYSTFLGGAGGDAIGGMDLVGPDLLYVVGRTNSSDFPLTNWSAQPAPGAPGVNDAFLIQFVTDCHAIGYSTLIGGDRGGEDAFGIAAILGHPVVVGSTGSRDFPVTGGAAQSSFGGFIDSFVTRVTRDGRSIPFATYLGGDELDELKLIVRQGQRLPVLALEAVFFTAGESRSGSLHETDAGAKGLSDVFVVRWKDSRPQVVTQ